MFVLTLFGLVYVFLRVKIDTLAKENKKQEQVLAELRLNNDRRALDRQKLTTPNALVRRLAYFHIEMVDLNRLQVLDAQAFRGPGDMVARGPSANGGTYP